MALTADRAARAWEGIHERTTSFDEIEAIYAKAAVFQDPIVRLEGKDQILRMTKRLVTSSRELSFKISVAKEAGDDMFFVYTMKMVPKRGPAVVVDAATHLRVSNDLIVHHRDYWDLLGGLFASHPLAERAYKSVLHRLG